MAYQDVIQNHLTQGELDAINTKMDELWALLNPKVVNLTEQENDRYGSINEKNKGIVNKANDYNNNQPSLNSPEVDWVEYKKDYFDRSALEGIQLRLLGYARACEETKRAHDYDNYQNALTDKEYAEYKAKTGGGVLYETKAAEYKQFFT